MTTEEIAMQLTLKAMELHFIPHITASMNDTSLNDSVTKNSKYVSDYFNSIVQQIKQN